MLLGGLCVVGVLPALVYMALAPDGLRSAEINAYTDARWLNALKFLPLPWLPHFAAGVVAGKLFVMSKRAPSRPEGGGWFGRFFALPEACVFIVVLTGGAHLPYTLVRHGLFTPIWLLLVVGLAQGRGALTSLARLPIFRRLGAASFSLFALHLPLSIALVALVVGISKPGEPLIAPDVYLLPLVVGVIVASLAFTRWVERPIGGMLRRYTS
jgi:peptidoglycan/LPS O-acetylase OafA/YrhL